MLEKDSQEKNNIYTHNWRMTQKNKPGKQKGGKNVPCRDREIQWKKISHTPWTESSSQLELQCVRERYDRRQGQGTLWIMIRYLDFNSSFRHLEAVM